MKTILKTDLFATKNFKTLFPQGTDYYPGLWPAKWVSYPVDLPKPFVTAYKCNFFLEKTISGRIHVTADERFSLYLDGNLIGRGPDRGDAENWFVDTYVLDMSKGEHVLVAIVWSGGSIAPTAQMSVSSGLFVTSDRADVNALLGTGIANWKVSIVEGVTFESCSRTFGAGGTYLIDAVRYPWGVHTGINTLWNMVRIGAYGLSAGSYSNWGGSADHHLRPSTLPAMMEKPFSKGKIRNVSCGIHEAKPSPFTEANNLQKEHAAWSELIMGKKSVAIAPHTHKRILIDLDNYYCAYECMTLSGGKNALVRVGWSEGLYEQETCLVISPKGNRNDIEGKYFAGIVDTFLPDGGKNRTFEPLWWRSGRYVEIDITTKEDPLVIESFCLYETRYPLTITSSFQCDNSAMMNVVPMMIRSLEMCSHETPIDCPYYEQLMYQGDTRLGMLVTMCLTKDNRLVKKAIEMFAAGRTSSGLLLSNYPSRNAQVIPAFSLFYCCMVYDYALWRGDVDFVKKCMPVIRNILEVFTQSVNKNGLHACLSGWNYIDWASSDAWGMGVPPGGKPGEVNCPLNWLLVYTINRTAKLEEWLGEKEFSSRWRCKAEQMATSISKVFWCEKRGLFADDPAKKHFSEHAQCLALLSGMVNKKTSSRLEKSLVNDPSLVRTTIYFSYYLFETYRHIGRIDKLLERLSLWYDHADNGMKTTREWPEPTRSDCHGWGAHPLYHYYSSIAGIRPAQFGFEKIIIEPKLGSLKKVSASMVHPKGGSIVVSMYRDGEKKIRGTVTLPKGTEGTLILGTKHIALHEGQQII